MANGASKWELGALAQAMENAIVQHAHPRFLRRNNELLKFNGFWRDGDRQNVCLWTNKATWHDAKTGQGGGCKEFAKTAFNMTLPDFMKQFGNTAFPYPMRNVFELRKPFGEIKDTLPSKSINLIWSQINNIASNDLGLTWLEQERGFKNINTYVGSGFICLQDEHISHFETIHHDFLKYRLSVGPQLLVPLRSAHSDAIKNIFFRTITPCDNDVKTRLLPHAGGWHDPDDSPRAFGFPHLIKDFPNLVLCEGMADYLACELLLDREHNFLPIGVGSATALPKWANWLADNKFNGQVIIIFHLDQDKHGNLSDIGIGQNNAVRCANYLCSSGVGAKLFSWLKFMKRLNNFTEIRDLADVFKLESELDHLQEIFLQTIHEEAYA